MSRISDLQSLFTAQQTNGTEASARTAKQASATSSTSTAVATGRGTSDSSTVSFTGGSLVAVLTQSDVRADKVAQLQSAIASGTYNVPSGDVADKLIQHLLGKS